MSSGVNNLYEFGDFRFDGETNVLRRGAELIALSPKASELLKLLIERGGEIVSKREIFDKIWAETFVEDGVLTQNVYTLRRVLGTDENGRQYIENVARRGYRFAAPLKVSGAAVDEKEREDLSAKVLAGEAVNHSFVVKSETAAPVGGFQNDAATVHEKNNFYDSARSNAVEKRSSPFDRNKIYAVGGVALLLAVGFGFYRFYVQNANVNQPKSAPIEQARFQRLTDHGDVIHPTVSPSGELLVYVRQQEDGESLWLKQTANGEAIPTLPPSRKGYRSLVFSPDGSRLFFREDVAAAAIYQTSPYGGAPKKIVDDVWGDFSVSPDGRRFAFFRRAPGASAHRLILYDLDSGSERELSARALPSGYRSGAPAWSPDGKNLIVSVGSNEEARPLLLKINSETGREIVLPHPRWLEISRFLWMPDGANVVVTARAADESVSQIWLLDASDGAARRLTNDLENYFWLSLSADGKKLVTRQQIIVSHLWLLPAGDLRNAAQITFGERNHDGIRGLAWTQDGKIIFTSPTDTITDLYQINADGKNRRRLTLDAGQTNTYPATAAADGRYIFFTSHRSGRRQIWRMETDGRDQKQMTFDRAVEKESAYSAAVAPDGKEIYFIKTGASAPPSIWKVAAENDGAPQPVSHLKDAAVEDFLKISPDGKRLAYRHVSGGKSAETEESVRTVAVLPIDGNGAPQLFDVLLRRPLVQWKNDSTAFYYIAGRPNAATIQMQPLAGGAPQKIIEFPDRVFNFAWSPDGANLAVARGRQSGDAILLTNLP